VSGDGTRARGASERADRMEQPLLASLLLGIGLGGFVDGIVLHQILQWHHMLTATSSQPANTIAGIETNVLADGLFHAATWAITVVGLHLTVSAWRRGESAPAWRVHVGLLAVGWGVFNLVEGTVNHHVLGIHHVRDDVEASLPWDIGFLAVGALLVVGGSILIARGRHGGPSARQR
jgi:uncharacterized membrane protein